MDYKLASDFPKIISSEREDGPMNNDTIHKNLPKFLKKNLRGGFALRSQIPIAYCQQVHGRSVKIINKKGYYENCDGLVTGENIALIVKSADCIPLLFFDRKREVIGAIHVGRRSLFGQIVSKSLKGVFEKLALSPAQIKFFVGPHIRVRNYEIKEDVLKQLPEKFKTFITSSKNKKFFDLTGALVRNLESIGAKRENIIDCAVNTYNDRRFFSYRKGDSSLFVTLISY